MAVFIYKAAIFNLVGNDEYAEYVVIVSPVELGQPFY